MKAYNHWILFFLVIILSTVLWVLVDQDIQKSTDKNANAAALSVHKDATRMVSNSVTSFGAIVAGMQAFVSSGTTVPSAEALKTFLNIQLKGVDFKDPVVISFIDTNHTFIYSFNQDEMNPNNLVGKKLTTFRDDEEIAALNRLMTHDKIQMFEPINLVEGWVGIPVNFRVHINGKTLGYIASIVMFNSIVDGLYSSEKTKDYAFGFKINGIEFDREVVYDNTEVYNENRDPEYFRDLELNPSLTASTNLTLYGQDIEINTWAKATPKKLSSHRLMLLILFITFIVFSLVVTWQIGKHKRMTALIKHSTKLLKAHGDEIEEQNMQMKKLNTTKDRFFSIIAHDLRQPLTSIKSLLFHINNENALTPELNELMLKLGQSTNLTLSLLDNLLRWAMSQTGEISYKPLPLNLHSMIGDTVSLLKQSAASKHIMLHFEVDKETNCIGDQNMLTSVFSNLISNSIKFTPAGGSVHITSTSDDQYLYISIKDNGVGMDPEKLNDLFALSSRNSNLGTNGEVGTGLGLVLCKEFLEIHHGSIEVKSTLGEGTEFIVRIPKLATTKARPLAHSMLKTI